MENYLVISIKAEHTYTYEQAVPLMGIYPTYEQQKTYIRTFIKAKKQAKCSWTAEWIINCGIVIQLNTVQNKRELATALITTWMELAGIMLNRRSQADTKENI